MNARQTALSKILDLIRESGLTPHDVYAHALALDMIDEAAEDGETVQETFAFRSKNTGDFAVDEYDDMSFSIAEALESLGYDLGE